MPVHGRPLIVVDGANVIGSRPDGWWRDRAGAVRRLLTELSRGIPVEGELALVVEGAAREGTHPGRIDGVLVLHAPGSGDDAIVDLVRGVRGGADERPVTVVTADRALRDRVTALGATTVGPRWLWRQLEADA